MSLSLPMLTGSGSGIANNWIISNRSTKRIFTLRERKRTHRENSHVYIRPKVRRDERKDIKTGIFVAFKRTGPIAAPFDIPNNRVNWGISIGSYNKKYYRCDAISTICEIYSSHVSAWIYVIINLIFRCESRLKCTAWRFRIFFNVPSTISHRFKFCLKIYNRNIVIIRLQHLPLRWFLSYDFKIKFLLFFAHFVIWCWYGGY